MNFSRRSLLSAGAALAATPAAAEIIANGADQTVELQAAIDHAAVNGGLLRLGAGKFLVAGLNLKSSLQIEGVAGQTRLVALGSVDILSVEGAQHLGISGITFESGGNGLVLRNCGGRISGNAFLLQEKTGLFALDSRGLEISGNHVHDIGNNGIQVWTSEKREDGTLVIDNRVERIAAKAGGSGQNGNGINIYKAGQVMVANNRIADCHFSAIRNNAGNNCQILGNNISRTGEVAIYVEFAFEGVVVSSNMIDDVGFGISITNFNEGGRLAVCSGNLVRNAKGGSTEGVKIGGGIYAEADTLVSGNVVENAKDVGIGLGWGAYARNLSAQGNLIRECGKGISVSVTEGAGPSYLANNVISGSKTAAILGMDHREIVTDDLGKADAKVPELIQLKDNVIRA
ncbi:MAG TPA: TIGR03808 family TAT-translocated repetitive protein [Aestuariivirga sp.]|nr:TIGR03808 family TAT-translocated repetitive protein [Aestuariivirga sp.]